METSFFDICYELLSHYLHFPDVADTYKSINDGLCYQVVYPQRTGDYRLRNEIISYIENVRINNIIDAYRENDNPFALIPIPSGRLLSESTAEELYHNLSNEIPRLTLKGIHQTIKHLNVIGDDNTLTAELLRQDTAVLQKYGLQNTEEKRNGQA